MHRIADIMSVDAGLLFLPVTISTSTITMELEACMGESCFLIDRFWFRVRVKVRVKVKVRVRVRVRVGLG